MSGRARPERSLGQNFLVDPNLRAKIVEAAGVASGEAVLEIGPGGGALTEGLVREVERAEGRLVLCELDRRFAHELGVRYRDHPRVSVIERDILELPLSEVSDRPNELKVVGNIPYNLTSPIVFHLLSSPRPREILLMVQREVADRIGAEPGGGSYGALTVGVRSVAGVEKVLAVPRSAFRPRPQVDSTVIRLRPLHPPPMTVEEEGALRTLTRALFQWRRKQLGKTLRDHPDLSLPAEEVAAAAAAGGARVTDRPETVSPEGFVAIARALSARPGPR